MKKSLLLAFIVLFASLSGLLAGFDTGVISGALLFIGQSFEITPELSGFLVSSVSIGAILGAFINGILIDKWGRRNILLLRYYGQTARKGSHGSPAGLPAMPRRVLLRPNAYLVR